jgi:hypothetical protein
MSANLNLVNNNECCLVDETNLALSKKAKGRFGSRDQTRVGVRRWVGVEHAPGVGPCQPRGKKSGSTYWKGNTFDRALCLLLCATGQRALRELETQQEQAL